jgi:MFS family permease
LAGNSQTALIFIEKFGWSEQETIVYNTLISSISIMGISIGSLVGGKAISTSRRKAIFVFEVVAIAGSLICQILSVTTLCLGRFICGISGGVLSVVMSKSIYESVPEELSGMYGTLTNVFIAFGIMLTTLTGLVLPINREDFADDEMWRFVYACPIFIAVAQILLFLFVFKNEPILFSVNTG